MPQARLVVRDGRPSLGFRISADCTVSRVDESGPAAEGGLRQGDLITSINDVALKGEQPMAMRLLQSRKKGPVIIEVRRGCTQRGQSSSGLRIAAAAAAAPAAAPAAAAPAAATKSGKRKQVVPAPAAPGLAAPAAAQRRKLSAFCYHGCPQCYEAESDRREDRADGDSKTKAMDDLLSFSQGSKEEALAWAVGYDGEHQGYVARQLLQRGADVNAVAHGRTALGHAVSIQCPPIVRLLLEAGADHTQKMRPSAGRSSTTIFEWARLAEHQESSCSLSGYCSCVKGEVLKLLEAAETKRVRRGGTPLPPDPEFEDCVRQNESEQRKIAQSNRDEVLAKQEYEDELREQWRQAMIAEGVPFNEDDDEAWREFHS